MHPDLSHALATIDAALQCPGDGDRIDADTWEAITTLEVLDEHRADSLWRILAWGEYAQRRHQGRAVLEVLRGIAGRVV